MGRRSLLVGIALAFGLIVGCSAESVDSGSQVADEQVSEQVASQEANLEDESALAGDECTMAQIRALQEQCRTVVCPRIGKRSKGIKYCSRGCYSGSCGWETCVCV